MKNRLVNVTMTLEQYSLTRMALENALEELERQGHEAYGNDLPEVHSTTVRRMQEALKSLRDFKPVENEKQEEEKEKRVVREGVNKNGQRFKVVQFTYGIDLYYTRTYIYDAFGDVDQMITVYADGTVDKS